MFVRPLLLLPTALAVTLAACSAVAPRGTAPTKGGDAAVSAVYLRLDQASANHAAGRRLAREGAQQAAQERMLEALDALREASVECAALEGCDQQRFVAALDVMLREGDRLDAEDDGGDTTPEASIEAGESSPLAAVLPELGRSVTLLKGRELADVMTINGPVKAALEMWLTQYRPNLIAAWENYRHMRYLMAPEYQRAGLPEALLFGMLAQESGGKVHAVSRSGASGPLQFMYATGQRFGLRTVDGFDQRFDPALSARANAAYLNEQLAIFNDNLELVIGAYNGGEGAMRRRVAAAGGHKGFWDPDIYYALSQETRQYVPMVLAAAWLFLHPERYNLKFPELPGEPGSITLAQPASIADLTICLGQDEYAPQGWFRTLRNLNPALDPHVQSPVGAKLAVPAHLEATYEANCLSGPWPELAARLRAAIEPSRALAARTSSSGMRTYRVAKGDSLWAIARRTGCGSARDIAMLNGLRPPHYMLKPGQVLKLGRCSR